MRPKILPRNAIYLGIDPGLAFAGYVRYRHGKVLSYQLVKTTKWAKGKVLVPDGERIDLHVQALRAQILLGVDRAGIEGNAWGARNMDTRSMEAAAVLKYALWESRVPFLEPRPNSVKKTATGSGGAGKRMMIDAAIAAGFAEGANEHLADAYHVAAWAAEQEWE